MPYLLRKQNLAVREFISQCAQTNADVRLAAMNPRDLAYASAIYKMPRLRQIRKVKNVLAEAFEPELGNWIVLTTDLSILNMTPDELTSYKKSFTPSFPC